MLSREEVFSYGGSCPRERLISSFELSEKGCWEYTKGLDRCGYGRISLGKRRLGAHKVSYVIHKGDVPRGLVVMHSCDNPKCINPDHLSLGTVRDNVQDCISKGRFVSVGTDRNGLMDKKKSAKIIIAHNESEMLVFSNIRVAEKNGFINSAIYNCMNGKKSRYKGFEWKGVERIQKAR